MRPPYLRSMVRTISLRHYLLTRLLWFIVPTVVAGMGVHWYFERALLREQFDAGLVEKAMTLATLVTEKEARLELEFADEYMPSYSRDELPFFFQIWHPSGQVIERSYSLHGEDLPFSRGTLAEPEVLQLTLESGIEVRCVGIEFPVRLGTDPAVHPAASVVIALGADISLLNKHLRAGLIEVALTGLTSVLGISLVVLLALRKGVRLLECVAEDVDSITPASLAKPLDEAEAPEEIRPIVVSLNKSLWTIRTFVERERRFNSDVAHELRTPIAELRAAADVALRWPDSKSASTLAETVRAVSEHMGGLVESLLELATLESNDDGKTLEPCDLSRSIRLLVDQAQRSAGEGREISVDAPEGLVFASHPRLWEVAVRNLLDNALSHSPPGSAITVLVRPDGDGACVRVSNPTDSLNEEDVRRCADRLWRAEKRPDDGHFGLGLAIVQAATAKLGHRFEVRSSQGVFHALILRTEGPSSPI